MPFQHLEMAVGYKTKASSEFHSIIQQLLPPAFEVDVDNAASEKIICRQSLHYCMFAVPGRSAVKLTTQTVYPIIDLVSILRARLPNTKIFLSYLHSHTETGKSQHLE
jgi:hypothetical protein